MAAYLNGLGIDRLRRRENAEFDLQVARLLELYGIEARILEGCGAGRFGDGAIDRADGKHVADASAQFAMQVERGESATGLGEMRRGRIEWDLAVLKR